jgi:hypothetical protein
MLGEVKHMLDHLLHFIYVRKGEAYAGFFTTSHIHDGGNHAYVDSLLHLIYIRGME